MTTPNLMDLEQLQAAWNEYREVPPHQNPLQLQPGIYFDIPFEDYLRIPAINKSSLANARDSLAHFKFAPPPDDSPTFRMGTLVHSGKLEPSEVGKRYVVVPEDKMVEQVQQHRVSHGEAPYASPKATKHYKDLKAAFMAAHPNKQEVSQDWFQNLVGMLRSLEEDPIAHDLFEEGFPEVTIIWCYNGHLCKGRIDWLTSSGDLVDLKTTDRIFDWSVDKFSYHLQAGMYLYGYTEAYKSTTRKFRQDTGLPCPYDHRTKAGNQPGREPDFFFSVIEKRCPWTSLTAPVSEAVIAEGSREYVFLMDAVVAADYQHVHNNLPNREAFPPARAPHQWDFSRWYTPLDFPLASNARP